MQFAKIALFLAVVALASFTPVTAKDCLTDAQKAKLQSTVTTIHSTLSAAEKALGLAAILSKDPVTKKNLKEAVTVVTVLDTDLVGNLTKIADEACGSCAQITQAVTDGVDAVESALNQIDPDWQNNAMLKTIDAAIHQILKFVAGVCPSDVLNQYMVRFSAGEEYLIPYSANCLNDDQKEKLTSAVQTISATLNAAESALALAEKFQEDPDTKKKMQQAIAIIKVVDSELVGNLTKIASEACGSCSQITQAVADAIDVAHAALDKITPNWRDNRVFKIIDAALQQIVGFAAQVCPNAKLQLTVKLSDNCLSPDKKAQLESTVAQIHSVLGKAKTALGMAAIVERDAAKKALIKKAITVVKVLDTNLVTNLTKIAGEACGSCSQISQAVNDAVDAVETSLDQIDPNWKQNKVLSTINNVLHKALGLVSKLCPQVTQRFELLVTEDCLSPEQKSKLTATVTTIHTTLSTAEQALGLAALLEKDAATKALIAKALVVIKVLDTQLVSNLTKIADEACGSCSQITKAVTDALDVLEASLNEIAPNWRENNIMKTIDAALHQILTFVAGICPTSVVIQERLAFYSAEQCLTPAQQQKLDAAVKTIHSTLSKAQLALRVASFTEKDAGTKALIKKAMVAVKFLDTQLVGNLTKIREEACGSCSQITAAVDDAVDVLAATLDKINPNWRQNAVMKTLDTALRSVVQFVSKVCASAEVVDDASDCLTEEKKEQLNSSLKTVSLSLETAEDAMTLAARFVQDESKKKVLLQVVIILKVLDQAIVQNVTKIANEACGTCSQITQAVEDSVEAVETALDQIEPDWKTNNTFKIVDAAIHQILTFVQSICPAPASELAF